MLFAGRMFTAIIAGLLFCQAAEHAVAPGAAPQCAPIPRDCAALALTAMGGRVRIEAVKCLHW